MSDIPYGDPVRRAVPVSRGKVLLYGPLAVLLGGAAAAGEIVDHGLSGAILGGVIAGALLGLALIAAIGANWHTTPRVLSAAEQRREHNRIRSVYFPIGLAGTGLISMITGFAGSGGASAGAALAAGAGILFAALGASALALAIGRPELWQR